MRYLRLYQTGFTLVEMAVVLVILGLMIGGLVMPLTAQMDQRDYTETRHKMDEIKEALVGYAIINGRLPCPTTQTNPAAAGYGEEDASCMAPTAEGYLPWKTLGLLEIDNWGTRRTANADPWLGYFRYRVHPRFSDATTPFSLNTTFGGTTFTVRDATGNNLTTSSEPPVAIVYSTGKNLTADGLNGGAFDNIYQSSTIGPTYDDVTIWISRPTLINRMVAAGKLP